jgi:uncharacterized protein (TIGR03437 family)
MRNVGGVVLALCACTTVLAQPSIRTDGTGVVNSASAAPEGLANANIAQGSIFNLYGSNMGPGTLVSAKFPLQTTLPAGTGTSITVTVNGTAVHPFIFYTRADVVAAILPSNTPTGTGTVTVTYNGQTSASVPITVVANSLGIYANSGAGSGPGVAQLSKTGARITSTASAKPLDKVTIWVTGAGPVAFDESNGAPNPPIDKDLRSLSNPQVYVGGKMVTPTFMGRAPTFSGADIVNFQLPADVATGCYVPVSVQTNQPQVSNVVTIPVATNGGACSDANGLSSADLGKLQTNGSLKIGFVGLSRTTTPAIGPVAGMTTDGAFAGFVKYSLATFNASQGVFRSASIGGCIVFTFSGSSSVTTDPFSATGLDAGSAIGLTGPNAFSLQLKPIAQVKGFYGAPVTGDPFATGGNYTFTGTGGVDVKAFNAVVTEPPALTWTNASQITTVHESQGQLITWTGGDPSGTVVIAGFSSNSITPPFVGATFTCTAKDSALQFMIPSAVLLALPPSPTGFPFPIGSLSVGSQTALSSFTAPGIDVGWGIASDTTSQLVDYVQQ